MRQVRLGQFQLPPCWMVKPNTLPLPLGRAVITLPLPSQLVLAFQVAMIFCGELTVTVTTHLVNEDEIDPLIRPRSARLPGLPEGLSCIAVLSEVPHSQGDYQEAAYGYPLDEDAVTELSGQTVGSIDSDCG